MWHCPSSGSQAIGLLWGEQHHFWTPTGWIIFVGWYPIPSIYGDIMGYSISWVNLMWINLTDCFGTFGVMCFAWLYWRELLHSDRPRVVFVTFLLITTFSIMNMIVSACTSGAQPGLKAGCQSWTNYHACTGGGFWPSRHWWYVNDHRIRPWLNYDRFTFDRVVFHAAVLRGNKNRLRFNKWWQTLADSLIGFLIYTTAKFLLC